MNKLKEDLLKQEQTFNKERTELKNAATDSLLKLKDDLHKKEQLFIKEKNNFNDMLSERLIAHKNEVINEYKDQIRQNVILEYSKKVSDLTLTLERSQTDLILQQQLYTGLKESYQLQLKNKFIEYEAQISELNNIINSKKNKEEDIEILYKKKLFEQQNLYIKEKEIFEEAVEKKIINIYQPRLDLLTSSLEVYKKQLEENSGQRAMIEKIGEQLKPVLKFYGGTNEEKGTSGEEFVMHILQNEPRYSDAIIKDVSDKKANGDILFLWRGLRCLIEVKNKKNIINDDMDKFYRDVKYMKESNNSINCAIFASLQSNNYPGRNREQFQIDLIDQIPTIFVHLENVKDINLVILCLEKLINVSVGDNESLSVLTDYFKKYYEDVQDNINFIDGLIVAKQKEIKILNKRAAKYLNTFTDMKISYVKLIKTEEVVEVPEPVEEEVNNSEVIKSILEQFKEGNTLSKSDILNVCNLTAIQLEKLGGYKKIYQSAKDEYFSSIINNSLKEKISNYIKENKSYPSRPTFIKLFLSDTNLRNLNKIMKQKKILEYIYSKCE